MSVAATLVITDSAFMATEPSTVAARRDGMGLCVILVSLVSRLSKLNN